MRKTVLIAVVVGLVVTLIANAFIVMIPGLQTALPNILRSMISGGLAGGLAVLAVAKFNKSKPE